MAQQASKSSGSGFAVTKLPSMYTIRQPARFQQAQRFPQPSQKPNAPGCEAEGRRHVSPSDPMDARREPAAGVKPQFHQHNYIVVLCAVSIANDCRILGHQATFRGIAYT